MSRGNVGVSSETMITVITTVLNGMPFLPEACESVTAQRDAGTVEHLVIDAGSTDGGMEYLRSLPSIRLIEAHAMPLYEAWNLGLREAAGEVVVFLNADDILPADALAAFAGAFAVGTPDMVCGRAEVIDQAGIVQPYPVPRGSGLDLATLVLGVPIINAKAFRRALLLDMGGFDPRLRIAADRHLLIRLCLDGRRQKVDCTAELVYRYRAHDRSQTLSGRADRRLAVAQEHLKMVELLRSGPTCPDLAALLDLLAAKEQAAVQWFGGGWLAAAAWAIRRPRLAALTVKAIGVRR